MAKPGALHVGTCGRHYRHWIGPFYPAGTRHAAFLARYAERFSTVEVDNSFYRLPAPETLRRWRCNVERLEAFLAALPARGPRCAFEFRDESWFDPAVYRALEAKGAAFCLYDLGGRRTPPVVTANFIYLRLHGPGAAYQGSYSARRLARLAAEIREWRWDGRDCFVYFDNDAEGHAPRDALSLLKRLRN